MQQLVDTNMVKLYYKDRPETMPSLIEEIRLTIEHGISKEVADLILNDTGIKTVLDKYPEVQQMSLHIYFNKLLLRYGYLTNTDVTHLIKLIRLNDLATWANSLRQYILPFIIENNVIQVVNNIPLSTEEGQTHELQVEKS